MNGKIKDFDNEAYLNWTVTEMRGKPSKKPVKIRRQASSDDGTAPSKHRVEREGGFEERECGFKNERNGYLLPFGFYYLLGRNGD